MGDCGPGRSLQGPESPAEQPPHHEGPFQPPQRGRNLEAAQACWTLLDLAAIDSSGHAQHVAQPWLSEVEGNPAVAPQAARAVCAALCRDHRSAAALALYLCRSREALVLLLAGCSPPPGDADCSRLAAPLWAACVRSCGPGSGGEMSDAASSGNALRNLNLPNDCGLTAVKRTLEAVHAVTVLVASTTCQDARRAAEQSLLTEHGATFAANLAWLLERNALSMLSTHHRDQLSAAVGTWALAAASNLGRKDCRPEAGAHASLVRNFLKFAMPCPGDAFKASAFSAGQKLAFICKVLENLVEVRVAPMPSCMPAHSTRPAEQ